MPQCYLILNNDINLLYEQIKRLDNEKNRFYIHIDKKYTIDSENEKYQTLSTNKNVFFSKERINVQWGSFRLIEAILILMRMAKIEIEINYIHLLSTQCLPTKSNDEIEFFFAKNKGKQFLSFFKPENIDIHWERRMKIYSFHEWFNPRSKSLSDIIKKNLVIIPRVLQKFLYSLGVERGFPKTFPKELYGGSGWWSISLEAMLYILDFIDKNQEVYNRFRFTQLPDEYFFQTLLLNSHFKEAIENNNLRYIRFSPPAYTNAQELGDCDIENLKNPSVLFARKFSFNNLYLLENLKSS
jgi:hypothetical protein